jgi:hypothetical protein
MKVAVLEPYAQAAPNGMEDELSTASTGEPMHGPAATSSGLPEPVGTPFANGLENHAATDDDSEAAAAGGGKEIAGNHSAIDVERTEGQAKGHRAVSPFANGPSTRRKMPFS